ncbi:MAG: electron transport complex subunit RsxC [Spirochaetales bacterium]
MAETLKKFPIGGVHLPEQKDLTTDMPIETMKTPAQVAIPLKQHAGVASRPVVEAGARVRRGTLIAMNDQGLGARVHASIPGTVAGIEQRPLQDGQMVDTIVIDHDPGLDGDDELMEPIVDADLTPQAVRTRVEEAGIVGLGGAGFPTHIKLRPPAETPIDTVLINGAECEPFLTVDDRLMQEQAQALFRGLDIIRMTVGAQQGIAACEVNKPKALEILREEAKNWEHLEAVGLDTRYPHGAEKQLVKAVLDREVPKNSLPSHVGCVVNNVQTTVAIARAIDRGEPLTHRVLTVSGHAVQRPSNVSVPVGASMEDIIAYCGGVTRDDAHLIVGGPMTGLRIYDTGIPVVKATSGIVLLSPEEATEYQEIVCIRCGKCVEVCPMYLTPNAIVSYVRNDMLDEAVATGLQDCILCGACAFACPSRRGMLQTLKRGKAQLANRQRAAAR